MSVRFKIFDASHDFSKTAALVGNHVVWFNLTIYHSMYESNQFVFKEVKQVNDEKQLLQIFGNFYFKMKCNNNKNDSFHWSSEENC